MITFTVRRREPEALPAWLNDMDVAARLGIARSTLWLWVDAGLVSSPVRVGNYRRADGRLQSRATKWRAADIELFCDSKKTWRNTDAAKWRTNDAEARED